MAARTHGRWPHEGPRPHPSPLGTTFPTSPWGIPAEHIPGAPLRAREEGRVLTPHGARSQGPTGSAGALESPPWRMGWTQALGPHLPSDWRARALPVPGMGGSPSITKMLSLEILPWFWARTAFQPSHPGSYSACHLVTPWELLCVCRREGTRVVLDTCCPTRPEQ